VVVLVNTSDTLLIRLFIPYIQVAISMSIGFVAIVAGRAAKLSNQSDLS